MSAVATTVPGATRDPDRLLSTVLRGVKVYDLGRPMFVGMPQSPNHPAYWHTLPRRHGDMVRPDRGSAANDLIVTGTHVGTHVDALAHVSHSGKLFGGVDAVEAGRGGRFTEHGAHTIAPMVCRGVLLDIPAALGTDGCPGGYEITPGDLERAAVLQQVEIRPGDVVLVRSGWGRLFDDPDRTRYVGHDTGVPGVAEAGARWLADRRIHAAGADTIAFERVEPKVGHRVLPAHRVMLVEHGIYLIEAMNLETLARDRVYEFTFVMTPLALVGATGSPVRPLALVAADPDGDTGDGDGQVPGGGDG